jgi:hypothetical protein
MSTGSSACACRGPGNPVGKCFRCGVYVCERCVTFVASKSVCTNCAKYHEDSIVTEVRRTRTIQLDMAGSAFPTDDVSIARKHKLLKAWRTLNKCFENALFILFIAGIVAHVVFFSYIMDFWSSYALAVQDRRNPLARLVLRVTARTDMLYLRYNDAAGMYGIFIDRYPENKRLAICYYRMGVSFLHAREYRLASHFLTYFAKKYPDHKYTADALNRIEIIKNIQTASQVK